MTDESLNNEVNALNVFGADEIVDRRQQAKALLKRKVEDITTKRAEEAETASQRRTYLQSLLEVDPRYQEIKAVLEHPDMQAIMESLQEHIQDYIQSWNKTEEWENLIAGKATNKNLLKRGRLDQGFVISTITTIPKVGWYDRTHSDDDLITALLTVGGVAMVNCDVKNRSAWFCRTRIFWDTKTDGMGMSYFDSSIHEKEQTLSRLDELMEKVAFTMSATPRLWAREFKEWEQFARSRREAIRAFFVMSKGTTIANKLYSEYFDIGTLWELGLEDEIKLIINQIHNQFYQTELLRQIANNTSGSARFSAASYGVSSSNAVALSGISEQISQLSQRIDRLSLR